MKILKHFLCVTLTLMLVLSTAPTIESHALFAVDPEARDLEVLWSYGDLEDCGDGFYSGKQCPISGYYADGNSKFIITPEGKVRMHGLKMDGKDSGCWGETEIMKVYHYSEKYDLVYFDMTGFKTLSQLKDAEDDLKALFGCAQGLWYNKEKKTFQDKTFSSTYEYKEKLDYSGCYFTGTNIGDVYFNNNFTPLGSKGPNLTDLTMLSMYLMGDVKEKDINLIAADINVDGSIDMADIAAFKQYVSKDPEFKIDSAWKDFIIKK